MKRENPSGLCNPTLNSDSNRHIPERPLITERPETQTIFCLKTCFRVAPECGAALKCHTWLLLALHLLGLGAVNGEISFC